MATGNQTNVNVLNQQLGSAAVARRDAARLAEELWEYIASLGADEAAQVASLQAAGFASGDAQDFWTKANYLHADALFYYGQLASPSSFDYDAALAGTRGGR